MTKLRKELGRRLFNIFDMHQFFEELELEGREAPSPEALSQLFDILSGLNGEKGPLLIDADTLVEIVTESL